MKEPIFLTVSQVESFHDRALHLFGGSAGVRSQSLLEAAVEQPRNVYAYEGGDLYDLAAAYCFHIAQAQAFVDGNKRSAVAAALVFLELNEVPVYGDICDSIYDAMIAMAQQEMDREGLAVVLRSLFGRDH